MQPPEIETPRPSLPNISGETRDKILEDLGLAKNTQESSSSPQDPNLDAIKNLSAAISGEKKNDVYN